MSGLGIVVAGWRHTLTGECPDNRPSEIMMKGYRRIFLRFEKLDSMFLGFLSFVLVADGLRGLC